MVCAAFDVPLSSYYDFKNRSNEIDVDRLTLRSLIKQLFRSTRNAAGSRTLVEMMRELGHNIGRFKVRSLMKEAALVSKQPGSHAYKTVDVERLDIPNHLDREFEVEAPNKVWCGDITYVWADNRWHYLAVVLDLCRRRVIGWAISDRPDAELAVKALDMAYNLRA
jgi:putative transposase